jgi:hypothetical protein
MAEKDYSPYVEGPLHDFATGYYAFVIALGYTPGSARWQIWVMAKLSQWLGRTGLVLEDVNATHLEQFFADYRAHHYKTPLGPRRLGLQCSSTYAKSTSFRRRTPPKSRGCSRC